MKSSEMAETYKKNPTQDTLIELVLDLITETGQIAQKRGVKSDNAMLAVIRECDDKWHSFCNKVNLEQYKFFFKTSLHRMVPTSIMLYP